MIGMIPIHWIVYCVSPFGTCNRVYIIGMKGGVNMGKFIHAPDEESAPYIDFNDEGDKISKFGAPDEEDEEE